MKQELRAIIRVNTSHLSLVKQRQFLTAPLNIKAYNGELVKYKVEKDDFSIWLKSSFV